MYQRSPRKYSASPADSRQQKMDAQLTMEEKNREIAAFNFKGFWFRPQFSERGYLSIGHVLCPRSLTKDKPCLAELSANKEDPTQAHCQVCESNHQLPYSYEDFRNIAHKAYDGMKNYEESKGRMQTLDVPFDAIKAKDEDETRKIEIKWSQKDGRNQAVIYFVDKVGNTTGAKPQVFVDMDRQEIRHDAIDQSPGKVLAEITATFRSTKSHIEYGEEK